LFEFADWCFFHIPKASAGVNFTYPFFSDGVYGPKAFCVLLSHLFSSFFYNTTQQITSNHYFDLKLNLNSYIIYNYMSTFILFKIGFHGET